jgi:DNA-binding GntR family transcriptional regulator
MDILDRVKISTLRMRYFAEEYIPTLRQEVSQEATREHLRIVAALRARDPDQAEKEVYRHLLGGEQRTLLGLRAKEQQPDDGLKR